MKIFILSIHIFLIIILSHSTLHAQSQFSLQIHSGVTLKGINEIPNHLNSGWNVGIGGEYKLVSMVHLSGDFAFHRFNLNEKSSYWDITHMEPQSKLIGEPSNIYEASLAIRFVSDKGIVRPFIILRSGIYFIHTGQFDVISWYPQPRPSQSFKTSAQWINRWFMSLGIGLQIPISDEWNILIESASSQTMPFDLTLFPVNAIIQFIL